MIRTPETFEKNRFCGRLCPEHGGADRLPGPGPSRAQPHQAAPCPSSVPPGPASMLMLVWPHAKMIGLCMSRALSVPAGALPAFAQGGQAAVMKHVKIEGDAEFATQIAKLA